MKSGGHAYVVDRKGFCDGIQITAVRRVHANADAGVGNHDIGHPLGGEATVCGGDHTVRLRHIGTVHGKPVCGQALGRSPSLDLLGSPRYQCQTPAGLVIAPGDCLTNATGGTGDKDQISHMHPRFNVIWPGPAPPALGHEVARPAHCCRSPSGWLKTDLRRASASQACPNEFFQL